MRRILMLSLCLVSLGPAVAAAQDDPRWAEARARFEEADQVYDSGDFEGALAEYSLVYDMLEGHERQFYLLFNMGRSQERLFRYDEAVRNYERFLEEGRAWSRRTGEALSHEAEAVRMLRELSARLATLRVTVNVDAAEVWVDDRLVGQAPGDLTVTEGTHVVELRARGRSPSRQQITIAARTTQPMSFTLDASFGGLSPAFFITGAALTAIAAGIGIGFGATALSEQSAIDAQLASDDPAERFRVTQARLDANAGTALIADVMYATAGVLGIATVVFLFVTDWGGSSADTAFAPWLDRDGAGVTARGRF